MGIAKHALMEAQEDQDWAVAYLVRHGVLKECDKHDGYIFDGLGDLDQAFRKTNADITNGKLPLRRGQTRGDITDLLQKVYESNSGVDYCTYCDKQARD